MWARLRITATSSVWPSRMWIIPAPILRGPAASENMPAEPSRTSSAISLSARSSIALSRNCRPVSIIGWPDTTNAGRLRDDAAMAGHLYRPSEKHHLSLSKSHQGFRSVGQPATLPQRSHPTCPSNRVGGFTSRRTARRRLLPSFRPDNHPHKSTHGTGQRSQFPAPDDRLSAVEPVL